MCRLRTEMTQEFSHMEDIVDLHESCFSEEVKCEKLI